MRHLIFSLLIAFLIPASRCGGGEALPATIVVGASKAPSTLPLLRMMENRDLGDVDIRLEVWVAPEQLIAMTQDDAYHFYSLPLTVAAKLHSRGVGVALTNVGVWGGVSLVTADPAIRDWPDLRGKTVHVPHRSSPPDTLTRFFLRRAGLDPERDVTVVHSLVPEMAQLLKAGRMDSAVLIEPRITVALDGSPRLRVAFDYGEEWRKALGAGAMLPSLGFGGNARFLAAHPELAARFEQAYEKALLWVLEHPDEAGRLAEKHLGLPAAATALAVPRAGLAYRSAAEARADVEAFYRVLLEFTPATIGDRIPDATFFWQTGDE